jgi:uncharacterized membrane protein
MNEITLTSLHNDILALRDEFRHTREELRHDIVRLEAKIDSKPSLMAMFTGIVVVVFGMAGVIASTIASLHSLGFIG